MFLTLQGEGAQAGRRAVFCRFAGCNLWSGLERDRATAICQFCDTEFVGTDGPGGGKFTTAQSLAAAARAQWDTAHVGARATPYIVCTGGEPALQVDAELVDALHQQGFEIAIETNGTIKLPHGIDWICMSPKAGTVLEQRAGDELKLVYEQADLPPDAVAMLDFQHFFLQPMDGPDVARHTQAAVGYCLAHPQWRVSLQTHKLLNIA